MRRRVKELISVILAVCMLLGMNMMAYAAGYNITIINNTGKAIKINGDTEVKSDNSVALTEVSSISGMSSDGLYQVTSWKGYSDDDVVVEPEFNLEEDFGELGYTGVYDSYTIVIEDSYLDRILTLSCDNVVDFSGDSITAESVGEGSYTIDIGVIISDLIPSISTRDGLSATSRWKWELTDSSSGASPLSGTFDGSSDESITQEVGDYRTLHLAPIYEYMVTYVDEKGVLTDLGSQTADEGSPITLPGETGTTSEGYKFVGWSDNDTLMLEPDTEAILNKNVTLYAVWVPLEYQVTYDGAGATSGMPEAHMAAYGAVITPGTPVREGYEFKGWEMRTESSTESILISPGGSFSMPAGSVALTAKWEMIKTVSSGTGERYLIAGQEYTMDGSVKVSGDPSVYTSGIKFYVSSSGNYTFE